MSTSERQRLAVVDELTLTHPKDPYLSLKALATYSSLSVRTLRKFIKRSPPELALPCYRLEGKLLVRQSDFDRYLVKYRAQGNPALLRALAKLGLDR